jgi:DtxR family Mn-dependent transcriptional regulator
MRFFATRSADCRLPIVAQTLSAHEYLEAIYEMAEEGLPTRQARVAEWLDVTPASVSEAVKRLARRGLVETGEDRRLRFTDEGERQARALVRRHRLAERFLVEVVGLPWHLAHEEATNWGRVISDRVEERLVELLDDPATCVHGNPIPGSSHPVDQSALRPLHETATGTRARLERLTEDLELDLDVMRFFEESGLMPDAEIRVLAVAPDGTMTLEVGGEKVGLGSHLADNLWVRALD